MLDHLKRSVNDLTFGNGSFLIDNTSCLIRIVTGTLSIAQAATPRSKVWIKEKRNRLKRNASDSSSPNMQKSDSLVDYVKSTLSSELTVVQEKYELLDSKLMHMNRFGILVGRWFHFITLSYFQTH